MTETKNKAEKVVKQFDEMNTHANEIVSGLEETVKLLDEEEPDMAQPNSKFEGEFRMIEVRAKFLGKAMKWFVSFFEIKIVILQQKEYLYFCANLILKRLSTLEF